ncbi:suppressor of RPS4-RLD 1-like isoform X1 [Durio zibethinus]|uniref:Suppressor of RPS4-RLD 1-like isoform X1 n=1 Tax=Durio zibethinus TaxID=66656 RepID=A0A6P5YMP7_DURZI|nr:suppressor of RPS4-RLD 1-like isoform X1 [Durio zibethinus]XP_022741561.1 suppressor of RPS4-RLD 1-like isoform X1 [Durio zibethinus]
MSSAIFERVELAKLCTSRNWSKAIRVLDSLLAQSCAIQDICNRAFCYSQLELHKHVIKDCDKALELDPTLLQAYILKGRAFSALGRKEDAIAVWEQGYEHALRQSADLKLLLELEELLTVEKTGKQDISFTSDTQVADSKLSNPASESRPYVNGKLNETLEHQNKYNTSRLFQEHRDVSEFCNKSTDNFDTHNRISDEERSKSSMSLSELASDTNGKTCGNYKSLNVLGDGSKLSVESADASENSSISGDNLGSSDQTSVNEMSSGLTNGIHGIHNNFDKPSYASDSCNDLSEKSEQCSKSSVICTDSNDITETHCPPNDSSDIHNEISDETKRNKKFCVAKISKTKSISVDFRLSRGIAQVNEGNYAYAISIFDQILKDDPTYPEALIGRGTAYAFQRELESAIADFTKAIQSKPSAGEAWKRRGQARAALGESNEAIEDLTKALEFDPNSADILHERGIVNFKFKDFNAAVEDLSACVTLDKNNKSAYTYLGMALSSIGEYKRAEEAHLKSIQLDCSFLEAWAHLTQFYQDLANSEKALECLQQVIKIDARYSKAYHLRGLLFHGMGVHRKAIEDLSIGLSIENSNIECLYLRASCYHAIGEYAEAVKDYDAALDVELDSMEKFVLQCLAFYQKEIALYTASKVNSEFCWFDIDGDIDPLFKEYWCKRLHPKNVCEKVFRQPPLRDSLKKGKLRKQDFAVTKHKTALLLAADSIGQKIQYDCPGFLPNRRQHRMAGLAAIEIAQKVSKAWRSLQADWKHSNRSSKNGKRLRRKDRISMASQNRGGAGCSTSSSSETSASYGSAEDRSSSRPTMSWQDVYSLAVKWRQISEPCDPVVWVNKLSEEFNSGFGSHTPMVLGQAKVVRYFPNHERTLNMAKTIMKDKLFVHNKADEIIDLSKEGKSENIVHAKSCDDLYELVGEDFWLATWCNSTAIEGKQLEGTRITLVKMGQRGHDFAIRTPCTPSRWEEFDAEMAMAWDAICNAYCGETYGSTDFNVLENVREAILRMTYYWYNFMPLSRGTAVVGFVVLLGLFLAANMEYTGNIPKGVQVDWEAILNFDPNSFVDSVKSWLYPSIKITTSWKDFPDVASTFATTGSVVAALSSYDN